MRNWKFLSGILAVIVIFIVFFVFFFNKKVPEPPKPLQKKVELPPPKPAEPPKKDMNEVKEEPKTKANEKEITKQNEKQIVREKKEPSRKQEPPVTTSVPGLKTQNQPKIVDFGRLNKEFSSYGLNVWASELKNNEIFLNGYVKNEKERRAVLLIARRYKANITDMINVVKVYSIEESDNKQVHQPLPFSR
ncbi:MAG: hypothetical protein NT010_05300 [Proteobacteria bacterium]|nr:hypothetical protein [Pseudomonadota bacterium]